jgi:FixJ family two-component response regulator
VPARKKHNSFSGKEMAVTERIGTVTPLPRARPASDAPVETARFSLRRRSSMAVPAARPLGEDARQRRASLDPVERLMLQGLTDGAALVDVAAALGLDPLAAEVCRARIFDVMGADNLIELLVLAAVCERG